MPTPRAPRIPVQPVCILAAIALFLSACANREERVQRIRAEAENALFEGDSEAAIAALRDGLDSYSDSNELRIALANALADAGARAEAADLIVAAIGQDPERADLWVRVAELRSRLGETEPAIAAFEAYLAAHPKDFLAWKELALENERAGRQADAIKAALQWNDLSPSAAPALKLGELYHASGNIPQARSWFGQAAAYEGGAEAQEALARLIHLETSLKQFEQSEFLLQEYAQRFGEGTRDSRIADATRVLEDWGRAKAEIASAADEIEGQRRELERQAEQRASDDADADSAPPADPDAPAASGTDREPEPLFGEDAAAEPSAPQPSLAEPVADERRQAAAEAAAAGDHRRAIQLLWQLLGESGNDPQLWYELAKSYSATESWFDAEACILEARRRAPDSEGIATLYALILPKAQSAFRATQEVEALRQSFPRSAGVSLAYARVLRDTGASRTSVARAYRDFLALAQDSHPGYAEATRYLQGRD